jgi:hypothetical protein
VIDSLYSFSGIRNIRPHLNWTDRQKAASHGGTTENAAHLRGEKNSKNGAV